MTAIAQEKVIGHFTINIARLDAGSLTISQDIPLDWLAQRLTYYEFEATPKSARVEVRVEKTGGGILVHGTVSADISTFCGTCLKDIVIGLQSAVSTYLVPKTELEKEGEDMELTPEDLDREYYEGDTFTLDELLGDALMLELPMSPKCRDKCPGLPSMENETSGTAIDPRLAPLANIRINKES